MQPVTLKDVMDAVTSRNITILNTTKCSMCHHQLCYVFGSGGYVGFRSGCGCSGDYGYTEPRTYDDVVEYFNLQPPEIRAELWEKFFSAGIVDTKMDGATLTPFVVQEPSKAFADLTNLPAFVDHAMTAISGIHFTEQPATQVLGSGITLSTLGDFTTDQGRFYDSAYGHHGIATSTGTGDMVLPRGIALPIHNLLSEMQATHHGAVFISARKLNELTGWGHLSHKDILVGIAGQLREMGCWDHVEFSVSRTDDLIVTPKNTFIRRIE